jgi:hypothetical protein
MRAIVRLLDHAIRQVEKGTLLQVRYSRENNEIRMTITKFESGLRSMAPPGSHVPPSLRPTPSIRPARAVVSGQTNDTDTLEFVHLAAEAHGGKLTVGNSALYRLCLPWVETKFRR